MGPRLGKLLLFFYSSQEFKYSPKIFPLETVQIHFSHFTEECLNYHDKDYSGILIVPLCRKELKLLWAKERIKRCWAV